MENTSPRDYPESAVPTADGLRIVFREIHAREFVDPFSHETVDRKPEAPRLHKLFSWNELARFKDASNGLTPKGIIMHPARVGSTLQVVCMRCVEGLVAYSEPMAICGLLTPERQNPSQWTRDELVLGLRLIADLLGRHATGPFVIKLRSWNCLFSDLICEAFPCVPWVFAVRDPLEIGVSLERKPPTWMRARQLRENPFSNFVAASGAPLNAEEYFASMFRSFCKSVGRLTPERGLLVRYQDLPDAVWKSVCPHFGIPVPASAVEKMKAIARLDAKSSFGEPRLFVPDAAQKRQAASQALREAVDQTARPALEELERCFRRTTSRNE